MHISSTLVHGIPISAWIAAVNARPLIQNSGLELVINERSAEDTVCTMYSSKLPQTLLQISTCYTTSHITVTDLDPGGDRQRPSLLTLVGHAALPLGSEDLKVRQTKVHPTALHPRNDNKSEDVSNTDSCSATLARKPWYKSKTALSSPPAPS